MQRLVAILVSIGIVGMIQGLIIPLLSLLLEERGASAVFNGLSTTAMFLGVIIASPFIETVVRRFGAKRTVLGSTVFCLLMIVAFPLLDNVYVWIAIRLLLGIGLSGLFVATEIWLNQMLTADNRGRVLAFYGLAIAIGMLIGPQGLKMLDLSPTAPFYACAAAFLLPLIITASVSSEGSWLKPLESHESTGMRRWWRIFWLAPFAMGASLVYGYLDGALGGDFPIFGARSGLDKDSISNAISLFVFGSIVFQFPLGWLSDKKGRRPAILLATLVGAIGFLLLPMLSVSPWLLMTDLFFVGGALGSFYSLGLASLGDLVGGNDIATANVMYTMMYGVGSLCGPTVTGWLITWLGHAGFAWSVLAVLVFYLAFGFLQPAFQKSSTVTQKGQGV